MIDIRKQPSRTDQEQGQQQNSGANPLGPEAPVVPEPETERGGSPAAHITTRTNEDEGDIGNS